MFNINLTRWGPLLILHWWCSVEGSLKCCRDGIRTRACCTASWHSTVWAVSHPNEIYFHIIKVTSHWHNLHSHSKSLEIKPWKLPLFSYNQVVKSWKQQFLKKYYTILACIVPCVPPEDIAYHQLSISTSGRGWLNSTVILCLVTIKYKNTSLTNITVTQKYVFDFKE